MDISTDASDKAFWIEYYRRFDELLWTMKRRAKHLESHRKAIEKEQKRRQSEEAKRVRQVLRRTSCLFNQPSLATVHPVSLALTDVIRASVRVTCYLWVAQTVVDSSKLSSLSKRLKTRKIMQSKVTDRTTTSRKGNQRALCTYTCQDRASRALGKTVRNVVKSVHRDRDQRYPLSVHVLPGSDSYCRP